MVVTSPSCRHERQSKMVGGVVGSFEWYGRDCVRGRAVISQERATHRSCPGTPSLEYSATGFLRKAEVGKLGASGWASKALAVRSKETLMVGPAAGDRRVDGDVVIESLWAELAPAPGRWQRAVFIGRATLTALVLSFSLPVPSFPA